MSGDRPVLTMQETFHAIGPNRSETHRRIWADGVPQHIYLREVTAGRESGYRYTIRELRYLREVGDDEVLDLMKPGPDPTEWVLERIATPKPAET